MVIILLNYILTFVMKSLKENYTPSCSANNVPTTSLKDNVISVKNSESADTCQE
jgi:hypothetical protein